MAITDYMPGFRVNALDTKRKAQGSESESFADIDIGEGDSESFDQLLQELSGTPNIWRNVPTVFACLSLISRIGASCAPSLVRKDAKGSITEVRPGENPLARILRRPNPLQTPSDFFGEVIARCKIYGQCYLYVHRRNSQPNELYIMNHESLEVRVGPGWQKEYRYHTAQSEEDWAAAVPGGDGGGSVLSAQNLLGLSGGASYGLGGGSITSRPLPGKPAGLTPLSASEVIHIRDFSVGDVTAVAPGHSFSRIFGLASGLDFMASKLAATGGQGAGAYIVKKAPSEAKLKDIVRQLKRYVPWKNRQLVLEGEWQWTPSGSTAREAQLLEQKEYLVKEIGRMFGVSPYLLGDDRTGATARSVEEMNRQFLNATIAPVLNTIGEALRKGILPQWHTRDDKLEVIFDTSHLTRANFSERVQAYRALSEIGAISPNEIRALEKMPPREGGDIYHFGLGGGTEASPGQVNDEEDEQN